MPVVNCLARRELGEAGGCAREAGASWTGFEDLEECAEVYIYIVCMVVYYTYIDTVPVYCVVRIHRAQVLIDPSYTTLVSLFLIQRLPASLYTGSRGRLLPEGPAAQDARGQEEHEGREVCPAPRQGRRKGSEAWGVAGEV